LVAPLRKEVWSVNKNAVICEIQTMGEIVAGTLAVRRFVTVVLSVFSLAAVILAVLGIYGVIAHSVRQRTHEIGIRMTLGAGSSDVLQTVLTQGLKLTLVGVAIGLAGAFGLMRVISSFLYDVSPTDPLTFVCVSVLLTGVAMLASYIPARRAARIDPVEALRYE
jgi:ABC-type antimicrobial peptide transport system permease subunit